MANRYPLQSYSRKMIYVAAEVLHVHKCDGLEKVSQNREMNEFRWRNRKT